VSVSQATHSEFGGRIEVFNWARIMLGHAAVIPDIMKGSSGPGESLALIAIFDAEPPGIDSALIVLNWTNFTSNFADAHLEIRRVVLGPQPYIATFEVKMVSIECVSIVQQSLTIRLSSFPRLRYLLPIYTSKFVSLAFHLALITNFSQAKEKIDNEQKVGLKFKG